MKKKYTYIFMCLLFAASKSIAQTCTAVPVVTLNPGGAGPIGSHLMVAHNPIKNLYYWISGGFGSNPIATHAVTGGPAIATALGNHDWRGIWWNSNTNTLEGNCVGGAGIYSTSINGSGLATGGSTIISPNGQPTIQAGGQYDPINNHVLYYNNGAIIKYSRLTGLSVGTVNISGLPVGFNNIASYGFYTGIPGMEYAVFDFNNTRAYYINYNTGAYVSTVQFPPSAGSPAAFALGYANGLFFIFDDVNWIGYSAGINASSSSMYVCPGGSVVLKAMNGSGYIWSTGAMNTPTISVSPSGPTVYSVVATATTGCPSTMAITVNTFSTPVITTSGNTLICGTGTNVITANGAASYTWSTGSNSSTISASPNSTTVYTVTGTNALGCTSSRTVSVMVDSNPTLSVNGTNISCPGQWNVLQANGAVTYSWSNGAQTFSTLVNPPSTTVYSVTGTSSAGCVSTIEHTINVMPAPSITVSGTDFICPGGMIILTASGANSYTWNTGANTPIITDTPLGNITYTVIGTSTLNGCSSSVAKTVVVFPEPSITINGDGPICAGQTATIIATGAATYTWNTGATSGTIFVAPVVNTGYTVIATSAVGCTASTTAEVEMIICTGIDNVSSAQSSLINVFPNPNNGNFAMSVSGTLREGTKLFVYSPLGQLVTENDVSAGFNNVDLTGSPGIYFLVIKENNTPIYTTRVVKQ